MIFGCTLDWFQSLENNIKIKGKQYGSKYHITVTIQSSMGDT